MRPKLVLSLLAALSLTTALATTPALPLVSPMFGDNMVLQRNKPIRIWGWANPGDVIHVEINGHSAKATTAADGRWQAELEAPPTGGPYTLTITAPSQNLVLHEILVGEVWLCGGQSNMELGLARTRNGDDEIKSANHPGIRLFKVLQHVSYAPTPTPNGTWKICSPQTIAENGGFSAVAYYFGRALQDQLHVPIGLVQDCVGGTPAESWMSPDSLRKLKDFDPVLDEIQRLHAKGGPEYGSFLMHWLDEYDIGQSNNWSAAGFDSSAWKPVQLPTAFADLGVPDAPSIVWFRNEFILPDPLPAAKPILFLGSIEKMDTTYINGHWVGASSWVENPRAYFIGDNILKPGRNTIAIRVFKMKPTGGFLAPPDQIRLNFTDQAKTSIALGTGWKAALSADARPPHVLPLSFENYPTMPIVLYEGMIEPVAPLSLRGAIWYQGEANFERAHQYRTLLPAMIGDWRKLFDQGDFPFYIVSLPAFMHRRVQPGDDSWAELREAQFLTAKNVDHSALAVTVDTGDADNIHPPDKKIVGERLALCALAKDYGRDLPYCGPTYSSCDKIPGALKLHFKHTDGGLTVKGDQLEEFSVAGADHKWHWADAKLDGETIIVSSAEVPEPIAARYAWQANPAATLFNGAGLPAVPFRTDDWPGVTDNHQPW